MNDDIASLGQPHAILFDLDGTLIDSAPDLADAVNTLLQDRGHAPLDLPVVTAMIGNGIRKLVERAFAASGHPVSGSELDGAYDAMLEIYGARLTNRTVLLEGARTTMATLAGAGLKLGVVTNKPQRFTETILEHFRLSAFADVVIGGDAGFERKPAPDMVLAALSRLGVHPSAALMVGDSPADAKSSRAAGVPVVLLRGGYTTVPVEDLEADAIIDRLEELLPLAGARLPALG